MRTIYHFLVGIFLLIALNSFGQTAVLTGDLRYDNAIQSPLAGVPVHLRTLLGNIVASDTTDSSGFYQISGFSTGNYVLEADVNYTWGGVSATDALQVTRYFNSLVTLSPLQIRAGDVNGSNTTNSADALLISRRITGVINSFSVGNFTGNSPSVNATGSGQVLNLRVLSSGDVNKTYNPLPSAPSLELDTVFGNGNVGEAVVRFTNPGAGVYERGICWGNSPNPTLTSNTSIVGSGGFGFTHSFSSIDPNTIQYARAFARTSAGVYYSNERSFTPIPGLRCPGTPSVTDIDGNLYHTVQIGNQCWTQSNLKVSKYRNGDNIPTGLSNSAWQNTTAGAYAIYNNDPVNDGLFGKLYNHYAVTDSRGLCPTGWHVPSDAEWTILESHLGGSSVAGGALKSTATQPTPGGWASPNTGATNSSGFTALPGLLRNSNGNFDGIPAFNGYWWSSLDTSGGSNVMFRSLDYSGSNINRNTYGRTYGFSVRCLKNSRPQVNTTSATNLTPTTALVTGNVVSDGGDSVTSRGFVVYQIQNSGHGIYVNTTFNGTGTGIFSDTLRGLTPGVYSVRAYATNSVGTSYGNYLSFTNLPCYQVNFVGNGNSGDLFTIYYIDCNGSMEDATRFGNQNCTLRVVDVSCDKDGGGNTCYFQSIINGTCSIDGDYVFGTTPASISSNTSPLTCP